MSSTGRRQRVDREDAIRRYLELRPVVRARLTASVPESLHREFESLTAHQLLALLQLPPEGLSMSQLATVLGVMGATVSVLADRLVAQGVAVRMPDPADRRVVRLVPSERGQRLVARATAQQRRSAAEIFDRLSDDQVVAFLDVLETLAGGMPDAASPGQTDRGVARRAAPSTFSPASDAVTGTSRTGGEREKGARSPKRRNGNAPGARPGGAVRREVR